MLFVIVKSLRKIHVLGNVYIPALYGEELHKSGNKYKCIVMSHGMGGDRFLYSKICIDLASYGFIVAALEHK